MIRPPWPGTGRPPLKRPVFLAIVSAHVLAEYLARDPLMRPDGFVIEGHTAGGHNAPPRGRLTLDEDGEPRYGARDQADLARLSALGLPFWLAGSRDNPASLHAARVAGAVGVQAGTLFALCRESGLRADLRARLLGELADGTLRVRTDPAASPTGFPFKVARLTGTLSDAERYALRPRLCDLGHLRVPYVRPNGAVGYRCPGEPVHTYLRKGGDAADTADRSACATRCWLTSGWGRLAGTAATPRTRWSRSARASTGPPRCCGVIRPAGPPPKQWPGCWPRHGGRCDETRQNEHGGR